MFNNYTREHKIKVEEGVIEYFQEYVHLGQETSANPDYDNRKLK